MGCGELNSIDFEMEMILIKVLFLTNIPSPYKVNFFGELGKLCDLTVLYEIGTSKERESRWYIDEQTTYRSVCLNGIRFRTDDAICLNVIKYLRDRSYDMIFLSGYSSPTTIIAIEYLRLKRIPFVITVDGGMPREESGLMLGLKRHLVSQAVGYASPARATDELLANYGASADKIHRYPFTSVMEQDIIEQLPSLEAKQCLRSKLGMTEDKIVLSVGRFIYRKGYDILLQSAVSLPRNVGIYIVGGMPTTEYLDYIQEHHLTNVHFVGFMTKAELDEYYLAADIFVLPTRSDVWGLVINEAMAHGLPVITTDKCVAGLELVTDGENGYVVPIDDTKKLADVMTCVAQEELCQRMGGASLEHIREISIERMAQKYLQMVCRIMEK